MSITSVSLHSAVVAEIDEFFQHLYNRFDPGLRKLGGGGVSTTTREPKMGGRKSKRHNYSPGPPGSLLCEEVQLKRVEANPEHRPVLVGVLMESLDQSPCSGTMYGGAEEKQTNLRPRTTPASISHRRVKAAPLVSSGQHRGHWSRTSESSSSIFSRCCPQKGSSPLADSSAAVLLSNDSSTDVCLLNDFPLVTSSKIKAVKSSTMGHVGPAESR